MGRTNVTALEGEPGPASILSCKEYLVSKLEPVIDQRLLCCLHKVIDLSPGINLGLY